MSYAYPFRSKEDIREFRKTHFQSPEDLMKAVDFMLALHDEDWVTSEDRRATLITKSDECAKQHKLVTNCMEDLDKKDVVISSITKERDALVSQLEKQLAVNKLPRAAVGDEVVFVDMGFIWVGEVTMALEGVLSITVKREPENEIHTRTHDNVLLVRKGDPLKKLFQDTCHNMVNEEEFITRFNRILEDARKNA